MANFPTSLDTLTNPSASDFLNSPSHSGQHATANDILEALEAKVGINASAVTTSHDYKLSAVTGVDKALGATASQDVSGKRFLDAIYGAQLATPSNPSSGYNKLYFKSDGLLYKLDSAGSETLVGGSSPKQEGFINNGRISVTVSANDLIVALKTLAGANPSASDPVTIVLNGVERTITSALSKTLVDGTNWFNSGSTILGTKEVDYFVYLGYNATDGVVIGISRIPYANKYGDFHATSTNEKYCAISTITNAVSTDYYAVIGRFAATLSLSGTSHLWTVPTFTAENLIQKPIFETRWLTSVPAHSASGAMTFTSVTGTFRYKLVRDTLYLNYLGNGTLGGSASVAIYATSPFTFIMAGTGILCVNNNTQIAGIGRGENAASVEMYIYTGGNWTLSANSGYRFTMAIQI